MCQRGHNYVSERKVVRTFVVLIGHRRGATRQENYSQSLSVSQELGQGRGGVIQVIREVLE